jgi:hypothetical protein
MKKNRAYYYRYQPDDPIIQGFEGRTVMIHHVSGHNRCTPNHPVITSPITKVFKHGRFHTQNTIWTLTPNINR